jgi:SAM-dependent methyltransferase
MWWSAEAGPRMNDFDPNQAVPGVDTQLPSLADIFQQHTGRLIHKWSHYFSIYERHLSCFRQKPVRVLEIGVSHGGSLQMWKRYFGEYAAIVGVDIDPRCRDYVEDGIEVEIGDQSDPQFWARIIEAHADFDVIIDDGSHISEHQRASFLSLWPYLREHGTYIVEDLHTSYWPQYGGGLRDGKGFIEFIKDKVDELNALWSRDPRNFAPTQLTFELGAIHFYDSMIALDKRHRALKPYPVAMGTFSHEEPESARAHLLARLGRTPER